MLAESKNVSYTDFADVVTNGRKHVDQPADGQGDAVVRLQQTTNAARVLRDNILNDICAPAPTAPFQAAVHPSTKTSPGEAGRDEKPGQELSDVRMRRNTADAGASRFEDGDQARNPARRARLRACRLASVKAYAQDAQGSDKGALELVDPNVFGACGYAQSAVLQRQGRRFESKLAELFAAKLGKRLNDVITPRQPASSRKTLGEYHCDIMGFPQGDEQAQVTIPYYRTHLRACHQARQWPRGCHQHRRSEAQGVYIGIVARTPPSTNMAMNGLLARAKSYPLFIDTRTPPLKP